MRDKIAETGRSHSLHMVNIEVRIPENAKGYVMHDTSEEMRNALLLYPSIANNTISHARAAELLGMHKMELIELYSRLGIPYIDMNLNTGQLPNRDDALTPKMKAFLELEQMLVPVGGELDYEKELAEARQENIESEYNQWD